MKQASMALVGALLLSAMTAPVFAAEGATPAPEPGAADAVSLATQGGFLDPGRYVDTSFGPTIELTLAEGWSLMKPDADDVGFNLRHREIPGGGLDVVPYGGRHPPSDCIAPGQGVAGFATGVDSAEGLAARLANHRYLQADDPVEVVVAGHDGVPVDVIAAVTESCEPQALIWVVPPYELLDYSLGNGRHARFIAIDVEGHPVVVIAVQGREQDFDAILAAAEPVLASMSIQAKGD